MAYREKGKEYKWAVTYKSRYGGRSTLNVFKTKAEAEYIVPHHTFYDCCGQVESIMRKVQKEVIKLSQKKE